MVNANYKIRYIILGLVCILIIILALFGVYSPEISFSKMFGNIIDKNSVKKDNIFIANEEQFIVEVVANHQDVINAANLIISNTQNDEVRNFTMKLIQTQTAEMLQLNFWKNQFYAKSKYKSTNKNSLSSFSKFDGNKRDEEFLHAMILHHQTTIAMAQQVLNTEPHSQIGTIAQNIINTYGLDIEAMKELVAKN